MDRRQQRRFDLNAPVKFSWGEPESIHGQGTTRDVSEGGIFVVTDTLPPAGVAVDCEVSFSFDDDSRIQMRTKGTVVRIETETAGGHARGFAAVTQVLWLKNPAFNPTSEISAPQ